jgi:hypothetical protein
MALKKQNKKMYYDLKKKKIRLKVLNLLILKEQNLQNDLALAYRSNIKVFKPNKCFKRLVLQFSEYSCNYDSINSSIKMLSKLLQSTEAYYGRISISEHLDFMPKMTLSNKKNQMKGKSRITVIRSPFVFKKTREQFLLQRLNCTVSLILTKPQQSFLLPLVSITKFATELKIMCFN